MTRLIFRTSVTQLIGHRTYNFSHTFTAIFAVFAPEQDGVRNREKVFFKALFSHVK